MFTGENSKAYGGHKSTTSQTTRHVQAEETAGEVGGSRVNNHINAFKHHLLQDQRELKVP